MLSHCWILFLLHNLKTKTKTKQSQGFGEVSFFPVCLLCPTRTSRCIPLPYLVTNILGWPKISFGFFSNILWKNLNKLFLEFIEQVNSFRDFLFCDIWMLNERGFCGEQDIYDPLPDNLYLSSGLIQLTPVLALLHAQQFFLGLLPGTLLPSPALLWCPSVESICTFKWPGQSLDPKASS